MRADRSRAQLISCIGTEFDLPLLRYFIEHYRILGIHPDRMHFIVHSRHEQSHEMQNALSELDRAKVETISRWIGEYSSSEMWQRRRELQQQCCMPTDWIVSADIDEFHEYPAPLNEFIDYCEAMDLNCVQGPFIDRISHDGVLKPIDPKRPLANQYAVEADVMCRIGKIPGRNDAVGTVKLMLFRGNVRPDLGGHNAESQSDVRYITGPSLASFPEIKESRFRFGLPARVHHFKWRESMLRSIVTRFETPGASTAGSVYGRRLYAYFKRTDGRIDFSDIRVFRTGAPIVPPDLQKDPAPSLATRIGAFFSLSRRQKARRKNGIDHQDAPPWQSLYGDMRQRTQSIAKPLSPPSTEATSFPGWEIRQLTRGTDEGLYHSHSYYDLRVLDASHSTVVAHQMRFQERWMTPQEPVVIGTAPIDGTGFTPIDETTAWSWQQGPMAQWIPESRKLIWNFRERQNTFASRQYDIAANEFRDFSLPVYAIDPSGNFALCVNMARLDRVRPGYGYACRHPLPSIHPIPSDDGVYRLDLVSGEYKLILPIERAVDCLRRNAPRFLLDELDECPRVFWFNHVKMAPSGKRFTLKLRWRDAELRGGWNGRMGVSLTCNADGSNLAFLQHSTSHVMWWSDSILYYWHERTRSLRFIKDQPSGGFDLGPVLPEVFDQNVHIRHIPVSPFEFIFDLPYREVVELKELILKTGKSRPMASFPNHIPPHGPFRCDLHPVPSPDGRMVIVTSLQDGGRQIYLVRRTT